MIGIIYVLLLINGLQGEETYDKILTIPLDIFDGSTRYACTASPIEADQYIVEFIPNIASGGAHHLTIALCDEPFDNKPHWSCFDPKKVCSGNLTSIVSVDSYGKPWILQKDLAIYTGDKPTFLIFQVHGFFKPSNVSSNGKAEMKLKMTKDRRRHDHAVHLSINGGYIPNTPGVFKADSACYWSHNFSAKVYSFSMHTHARGLAVSGYIIRNGTWIEMGRGSPHYPKVLYDVSDKDLWFEQGDIIAARCTYDNYENRTIQFGYGEENEMCTFASHIGVTHDAPMDERISVCAGDTPEFKWEDYFEHIPNTASDTSGNTVQNRYIIKHNMHVKNSYVKP